MVSTNERIWLKGDTRRGDERPRTPKGKTRDYFSHPETTGTTRYRYWYVRRPRSTTPPVSSFRYPRILGEDSDVKEVRHPFKGRESQIRGSRGEQKRGRGSYSNETSNPVFSWLFSFYFFLPPNWVRETIILKRNKSVVISRRRPRDIRMNTDENPKHDMTQVWPLMVSLFYHLSGNQTTMKSKDRRRGKTYNDKRKVSGVYRRHRTGPKSRCKTPSVFHVSYERGRMDFSLDFHWKRLFELTQIGIPNLLDIKSPQDTFIMFLTLMRHTTIPW